MTKWTQVPTTLCRIFSTEDNTLVREIEVPDNILLWQFEESLYNRHQYLIRSLHQDHLTPPRPTHFTHRTFTARAILPTQGSSSLSHNLYVTDQVAVLMLCPALPVGDSALTFSQAASHQNSRYTVDLLLQPFRSLSHVPAPPIKTQTRRSQHTKRY